MKTGYICSSGFNLAATATRRGRRLVAIVLGAPNAKYREEVAASLLEGGFAQWSGFNLLGRRGVDIRQMQRPHAVPTPVDMRPYICEKKKMPAHLAYFGIGPATAEAPNQPPSPATESGSGNGLPNPLLSFAPTGRDADPLATLSVPLPRPRPAR